ncbi:MAG: FkbM family methyltransferase [Candidatus Heimdallarchaeota archaeon]
MKLGFTVKRFLLAILHRFKLKEQFAFTTYSQEGEDAILRRIFEDKKIGFYIDVGAHHPKRFSNTYYFYKKGWSGINIDAMPGSMRAFKKTRKKDINLEIAISEKNQELIYYFFNDPALNGFSKEISEERNQNDKYRIIAAKKIKTETLAQVLDTYLPPGQKITFMTIDAEGLDYEVLVSNDWDQYRPMVLLVEDQETDLDNLDRSNIVKFMKTKGYTLFAKTFNTLFFKQKTANDPFIAF